MLSVELEIVRGSFVLDVALSLPVGPTLLVGPNGSGKSTLLRGILGAVPVRRGKIVLGERTLLDTARGVSLPTEERRVAWVPQEYALFPHLTVLENVTFGTAGTESVRGRTLLEQLGLGSLRARRPGALSGGERQKVALARALAAEPEALLLDEPLAALDVRTREETRQLLAEVLRNLRIPAVIVTHDVGDIQSLGAPVVLLESGRARWEQNGAGMQGTPPDELARTLPVKLT